MIDPNLWFENVREDLKELSSRNYQVTVWKEGKGPEASCYVEFMCRFFDDNQVGLFLEQGKTLGILNDRQHIALSKVVKELELFSNRIGTKNSAEEILSDPGWERVVDIAQQALKEFCEQ